MKILAIETSCDETAISIIKFSNDKSPGDLSSGGRVLSHIVSSQVALHAPFGGVVPNIAKREHQKNLIPLLKQALKESNLLKYSLKPNTYNLESVLEREPELLTQAKEFLPNITVPDIDLIAVTNGPGLELALWVGLNFAKALAIMWQKPLVPINHMEGHVFSGLLKTSPKSQALNLKQIKNPNFENLEIKDYLEFKILDLKFPAVALLISGGHTELVLIKDHLQYKLLGQTRDDAVGEAFDKVARLLGLHYPGGPEISVLAEKFNPNTYNLKPITLPRPMINTTDLDFSFSGLKTAVRYLIENLPKPLSEKTKIAIAYEFETAITEVLVAKTKKAIEQTGAKTLLVGGGVIANKRIRKTLRLLMSELGVTLHLPEPWLTGDNATMIALAAYFRHKFLPTGRQVQEFNHLRAEGTLRLH